MPQRLRALAALAGSPSSVHRIHEAAHDHLNRSNTYVHMHVSINMYVYMRTCTYRFMCAHVYVYMCVWCV